MYLTKSDYLGIALFLLLGSCVFEAKASMFIEVGSSHFQKPPNGIWWQDQYPSVFDLDGKYIRVGMGDTYRISYYNLGRYKTEAIATGDEAKYFSGQCNSLSCAAPDLYVTRGSVQGMLFSYVFRSGMFHVEPGISYTKQDFDLLAKIVNNGSANGGPVGRSFSFSESKKDLGYMLGLGLEYRSITIAFNYFKNDKSAEFVGSTTPGIDTVTALAIGYRF